MPLRQNGVEIHFLCGLSSCRMAAVYGKHPNRLFSPVREHGAQAKTGRHSACGRPDLPWNLGIRTDRPGETLQP
jgi:hypothetical protein